MASSRSLSPLLLSLIVLLTTQYLPTQYLGAEEVVSPWTLSLRHRVETAEGSGRYHTLERQESWRPAETAVIVCDMWDLHHCLNATRRGAEMAPRMNAFLKRARSAGAVIIHAPSSCVKPYEGHPARERAKATPRSSKLPEKIGEWCYRIPAEERGEYPIDQSDGGEDDDPVEHVRWAERLQAMGLNPRAPWTKQTDALDIEDQDYVSDDGEEIWSILEAWRIENVVLVGVHTNMCVLGRPFGLRQMAKNGRNVVLVRDLTDTMYNPAMAPQVSHFTGTDLIVEHIEKFVCPTITSDQVLGGEPFRFPSDRRPHVVIVMAEREYRTNETLPRFGIRELGKEFRVSYVHADEKDRNTLPGIDALEGADVLLLSVRRRGLPKQQMAVIRRFLARGGAVVGIRTASHAFDLKGKVPEGLVTFPGLDKEVFGGNYHGHHGKGPKVELSVAEGAGEHPVLEGVDVASFRAAGSLYEVSPLEPGTQSLVTGSIEGLPSEPIAWTQRTVYGGRAFYTSLGHIEDFEHAAMRRLLLNAVRWAAE